MSIERTQHAGEEGAGRLEREAQHHRWAVGEGNRRYASVVLKKDGRGWATRIA